MNFLMNISVVVTCLNEEANIGDCLDSLIKQNYPAAHLEFIVVDGGSHDRTQEIIKEFAKAEPSVKLVVEPRKGTAAGRNAGIRAAAYEMIAFTDADCEVPVDWLEILAGQYKELLEQDKNIVAVGGTNLAPENSSDFVRAIEIAQDSVIGSFNAHGRQFRENRYVETLSNLNVLYKKKIMVQAGLYDASLLSEAEDADLNYRLGRQGYKFVFLPDSYVWHKMRATPNLWGKNMFRYGKGRARLLKRYLGMWNIYYCLPLVYLISMMTLCLSSFSKIFLLPALYFPFIVLTSFFLCSRKGAPTMVFLVIYVLLIEHFFYAVGEAYGLLNPGVR